MPERSSKYHLIFLMILLISFYTLYVSLSLTSHSETLPEIDVCANAYKVVGRDTFDTFPFPVGRVRLADIDVPELGTPEGDATRNALLTLIMTCGSRVCLGIDDVYVRDRYDRLVYQDIINRLPSNISAVMFDLYIPNTLFDELYKLGVIFDKVDRALELIGKWSTRFAHIIGKTSGIRPGDRVMVFVETYIVAVLILSKTREKRIKALSIRVESGSLVLIRTNDQIRIDLSTIHRVGSMKRYNRIFVLLVVIMAAISLITQELIHTILTLIMLGITLATREELLLLETFGGEVMSISVRDRASLKRSVEELKKIFTH